MDASKPLVARVLSPRLRAWLSRARTQRLFVLLSVLLCCTSLGVGLQLDDHVLRWTVQHTSEPGPMWETPRPFWDLFRFADGTPADLARGYWTGASPWYYQPGVRLAFFRPLSALTHVFDYHVLDAAPWAMHLHSLLWLGLFGLLIARLVRRLEGTSGKGSWVAGLMLWFALLAPSRGVPAGWLSNRNQLIAGVFGALGFELFLRWRESERPRALQGAGVGLAVFASFFAGESAIAWLGYFLAYALLLDRSGVRRAVLALLPIGAGVIAWRAIYGALGYGTANSAMYVDPLASPLQFLRVTGERMPQLVAGEVGGPVAGLATLSGRRAELLVLAVCCGLLLLIARPVFRVLRARPMARFWALGSLFSAIPMCATQPHCRLMLVAGLGISGVVAHTIAHAVEGKATFGVRLLAGYWLFVLATLGPLRLAFEAWSVELVGRPASLAAEGLPEAARGKTLVVLATPDPMFMCAQLPMQLASRKLTEPALIRCLAGVEGEATISRVDDRTLRIADARGLMNHFFVPLLRRDSFPEDWHLELEDSRYRITKRDEEVGPTEIEVSFDTPLDDPALFFVVWSPQSSRYERFTLPGQGQSATVKGEPLADLLRR
ncbi:MAG: hypothetical protein KC766_31420 [Myxococcales bacterium]|nr:hypothetical protein [Myxococcales bacterium]